MYWLSRDLVYNNIVVFDTAIFAGMAELADALDSGSSEGNFVKVQVLLPAPSKDTIEIWTLKFGGNGVFIIKSSIYAAFRGRIFFLSVGLKNE